MATKTTGWNLRVAKDEDELVREASGSVNTQFSSFVRDAAIAEAHRVLGDRTQFALDDERWREFSELLARPPRVPSGLADLFSRPSVFE